MLLVGSAPCFCGVIHFRQPQILLSLKKFLALLSLYFLLLRRQCNVILLSRLLWKSRAKAHGVWQLLLICNWLVARLFSRLLIHRFCFAEFTFNLHDFLHVVMTADACCAFFYLNCSIRRFDFSGRNRLLCLKEGITFYPNLMLYRPKVKVTVPVAAQVEGSGSRTNLILSFPNNAAKTAGDAIMQCMMSRIAVSVIIFE